MAPAVLSEAAILEALATGDRCNAALAKAVQLALAPARARPAADPARIAQAALRLLHTLSARAAPAAVSLAAADCCKAALAVLWPAAALDAVKTHLDLVNVLLHTAAGNKTGTSTVGTAACERLKANATALTNQQTTIYNPIKTSDLQLHPACNILFSQPPAEPLAGVCFRSLLRARGWTLSVDACGICCAGQEFHVRMQ